MSGDLDLELRYRRVLRLLPGYYRDMWEEDMVAAFLDSWLTGNADDDDAIMEYCRPTWQETASVVGLAVRLHLGGAGAPRRYYAWGQAVRNAVLVVVLVHAVRGVDGLVFVAQSRRLFGLQGPLVLWLNGTWPMVFEVVDYAWIVIFLALVLGHYRFARLTAALTIIPSLADLLQLQLTGREGAPFDIWAYWILLELAPVLAMAAFYRDAPRVARRPWLLALPTGYLLVVVPLLVLQNTGNSAWLPDLPGLCCFLVSLACLTHVPRAWSRQGGGSGVWSLTLMLLAAVAGTYRIVSLGDYGYDPHLVNIGFAELLILAAAVALVARDAARAPSAVSAAPSQPRLRGV
jgi:hypothetical protein